MAGGRDESPPRAARRRPGRLRDGSASGSDVPEDEDEEESSDEELRVMAKIRRRRQQQQAAGQAAAAPRVRLRTGGRAVAEEGTPPKLRLKLSAAAAQPPTAGGTGRDGKGRARRQLDDDVDDDVADAVAAEQLARQPSRATLLKLKLKLSGSAAGIPQVDGTVDEEEEVSEAEFRHQRPLNPQDEAEEGGQQMLSENAPKDARTDTTAPLDEAGQEATDSAPMEGAKVVGVKWHFGASVPEEAAAAETALPGEGETQGDDDTPTRTDMATAGGIEGNGAADVGVEMAAHATNKNVCDTSNGLKAEDSLEGAEGACGEHLSTKEDFALAGASNEAATAPMAHSEAAPSGSGAEAEQLPSQSHDKGEQAQSDDDDGEMRPESGHEDLREVQRRPAKPLSETERTDISGLVHALRRWLRELGGHAPANMEDPEVAPITLTLGVVQSCFSVACPM